MPCVTGKGRFTSTNFFFFESHTNFLRYFAISSTGAAFRVRKKAANGVDLGYVGEISASDAHLIEAIWGYGGVPVLASRRGGLPEAVPDLAWTVAEPERRSAWIDAFAEAWAMAPARRRVAYEFARSRRQTGGSVPSRVTFSPNPEVEKGSP